MSGTIGRQPLKGRAALGHGVRDVGRDALPEIERPHDLVEVRADPVDLGNRPVVGRRTARADILAKDGTARKFRYAQARAPKMDQQGFIIRSCLALL
jgi:hypothetical protein